MKNYFTPDLMLGAYHELTPERLREMGIRALLVDIDNTLAPYEQPEPDDRIRAWLSDLRQAGISVALVSNNHAPRVERFNRSLGLLAFSESGKPRRKVPERAMELLGVSRDETAVLGDQLLTDAFAGKHIGLRAIIVPPIHDLPTLFFRFKRWCERPFIRKYAKLHGYSAWMSFWKIQAPRNKAREERKQQ